MRHWTDDELDLLAGFAELAMIQLDRIYIEQELAAQNTLFNSMIESTRDAVYVVDADHTVRVQNQAAAALGVPAVGQRFKASLLSDRLLDADGESELAPECIPIMRALNGESLAQLEVTLRDGNELRYHSVGSTRLKIRQDPEIYGALSVHRDISEIRRLQEELRNEARKDELTGLLNRRGFTELLKSRLNLLERIKVRSVLLYIDLDNMKQINDTFGHEVGDQALIDTGSILKSSVRKGDFVSRLGGDEFAVFAVLPDDGEPTIIENRIHKAVEAYNNEPGHQFALAMSIGCVLCEVGPKHTVGELMRAADAAMYERKRARKRESHPAR